MQVRWGPKEAHRATIVAITLGKHKEQDKFDLAYKDGVDCASNKRKRIYKNVIPMDWLSDDASSDDETPNFFNLE